MAAVTEAQRAAFSAMAFNPHQRRGPDGKWIKMGSGAPGSGLGRQVTVHHSIPFDGDIQSAIMESRFGDGLVELPAITVPEDEAAAAPAGGRRSIMLRVKVGADQPATDAGGGRIALPAGQVRVTDTDWVDNPDGSRTWIVDATYEGPATDAPAVVPPATVEDFDSATSGRAVWDAIPSSSSKVQDAAATYAGPSFREINGFLRGTSDYEYTGMGDDIKTLSDGINRNRLSTPAVVWRGIGSGARMLGSTYFDRPDLTGVEWEDPAFVSTTADEEVLIRERLVRPGGDSVKMRVLLPGGTGAIRVGQWEYEAEMLLDKGNRYRIVRDRGMVDGIRQLDVEVVPRGDQ